MTFFEEIKRPFNIVTTLLALISLGLSVVFYYNSKKEKGLSYQVVEPPAKIFDSDNSSPAIKLVERDSILIKKNVYLLVGKIWNSGNLPINKEDIRKRISINLFKSERILDYKITQQTDSAVSQFKLQKEGDANLNIDWTYFDPGQGFAFQILYIGDESSEFVLDGKILDVKRFSKVNNVQKGNTLIFIFVFVLCPIMTIFLFWRLYKKRMRVWQFLEYFELFYAFLLLITVLYFLFTRVIFVTSSPF